MTIQIPAHDSFTLDCIHTFVTNYEMYVDYCASLVATDEDKEAIIKPCSRDHYFDLLLKSQCVSITSETLEGLKDDFTHIWYESGMSDELDVDYEDAESTYIDSQIGTSDWTLVD